MDSLSQELEELNAKIQQGKINYQTTLSRKEDNESTLTEIKEKIKEEYQIEPNEIDSVLNKMQDDIESGLVIIKEKLNNME